MSAINEILKLAHEGLERCDEPQFSILNKIIALASKEAEAKSEAPASLVERLTKFCDNIKKDSEIIMDWEIMNIVNDYRPVPDRTAELVRELEALMEANIIVDGKTIEVQELDKKDIKKVLVKFKEGK